MVNNAALVDISPLYEAAVMFEFDDISEAQQRAAEAWSDAVFVALNSVQKWIKRRDSRYGFKAAELVLKIEIARIRSGCSSTFDNPDVVPTLAELKPLLDSPLAQPRATGESVAAGFRARRKAAAHRVLGDEIGRAHV